MADTAQREQVENAPSAAPARSPRTALLIILAGAVVLGLLAYGAYWLTSASHFVTTDNAYVGADSAQITSQVSAPVKAVLVGETQWVKTGDVLVELDDADAKLTLDEARADLARAQADYLTRSVDLARRKALAPSGAVSADELTAAQNDFNGANAALTASKAKLSAAELTMARMKISAPVTGVVSNKSVRVGQRVDAGQPLMVVAPIDQAYVDANFKEVELRGVEIGQRVILHSDLYGDKVTFHGVVAGLSGGTGAAFSLIPAQNASGNWIKVVQRVPVRIKLDSQELRDHPLRVGLSMRATIDLAHRA